MSKDIATAPLPALLTSREHIKVLREYNRVHAPDPDRTRAEYVAGLRVIAARMYPGKVSA